MFPNHKVYVLGAGVNESIQFINNNNQIFSPPRNNNFFRIVLRIAKYIEDYYDKDCKDLSQYIMQYWKKDKKLLLSTDFDLEECFTLLQLQSLENDSINNEKTKKLNEIYLSLINLLILVLKEFKWYPLSQVFLDFGKILYEEKPNRRTYCME